MYQISVAPLLKLDPSFLTLFFYRTHTISSHILIVDITHWCPPLPASVPCRRLSALWSIVERYEDNVLFSIDFSQLLWLFLLTEINWSHHLYTSFFLSFFFTYFFICNRPPQQNRCASSCDFSAYKTLWPKKSRGTHLITRLLVSRFILLTSLISISAMSNIHSGRP